MKWRLAVCVTIGIGLSIPTAFARGGMMGGGMSSPPTSPFAGGTLGTSAATPGTNSLGTALSSSGRGNGPTKGPLLGTSAAIDREEAKLNRVMGSICRGC